MKQTLYVIVLCALFASCKNAGSHSTDCSQQEVDSLISVINGLQQWGHYNMPTNRDSLTWRNDLLDTGAAAFEIHKWDSFVPGLSTRFDSLNTTAFVVSSVDLLHAIADSPNVSSLIFYFAMKQYKDTLAHTVYDAPALMYTPARSRFDSTGQIDSLFPVTIVNRPGNGQLYDYTYPCPTCYIESSLSVLNMKKLPLPVPYSKSANIQAKVK